MAFAFCVLSHVHPIAMSECSSSCQSCMSAPHGMVFWCSFCHRCNAWHRWFWTSQMREDEAYVFVNYDSRHDGRARFTPHSTIVDPNVPEDAPIRQSIETRAFVFWDEWSAQSMWRAIMLPESCWRATLLLPKADGLFLQQLSALRYKLMAYSCLPLSVSLWCPVYHVYTYS